MIATCAHNFMLFRQQTKVDANGKSGLVTECVLASTGDTTFYLQRDDDTFRMDMRVVDIVLHPDYERDGASEAKFLRGTDVALAVVQIPYETFRWMPAAQKEEFEKGLNIPQPGPYAHEELKQNVNDIAIVAGYPAELHKTERKQTGKKKNEKWLYADWGHIAADILAQGDDVAEKIQMLAYDDVDLVTSAG